MTDDRNRPRGGGRAVLLGAVAVAIVAILLFWPSTAFHFTGWDDGAYVSSNEHLRSWSGLGKIWTSPESEQYYPLSFTTYWVEYHLWGVEPGGYHVVNVLLHGACAALVVLLARALGLSVGAALVVGLWFAVHPLQVMSVAWIAERKNLLSASFSLLAMLAWLHGRHSARSRWLAGAWLAFVLALLSKTAVIGLFVALMVGDRMLFQLPWRQVLRAAAPYALAALGLSAVTLLFEEKFVAEMPELGTRLLIAPAALLFYLAKLVVPVDLVPIYPLWEVSPGSLRWWLPALAVLALTVLLWRLRHRLGGVVVFGVVLFVVLLAPILGLVPYGNMLLTYVSDHYVYLACVGFFLAVVAPADRWCRGLRTRRRAALVAAVLLAALWAGMTRAHLPVFRDAEAMWGRTLEANPECFAAHSGLGAAAALRGRWERAREHLAEAHRIRPEEFDAHKGLIDAHLAFGNSIAAGRELEEMIRRHPGQPWAFLMSGLLADREGRPDDARRRYAAVLKLEAPKDHLLHARYRLGYLSLGAGDPEKARQHFLAASDLDPRDPKPRVGQAIALWQLGRLADCLEPLEAVLRELPDDVPALEMLARILATVPDDALRDGERAVTLAERAVRLSERRSLKELDALAAAYAEAGRFKDAEHTAREASELAASVGNPGDAQVLADRATQYARGEPLRQGPP